MGIYNNLMEIYKRKSFSGILKQYVKFEENLKLIKEKEKPMIKTCENCGWNTSHDSIIECSSYEGCNTCLGSWKLKEKSMNDIERLQQSITDAENSIKNAIKQIEEIKEEDNADDWTIKQNYYLNDELKVANYSREIECVFSRIKIFNDFTKKEHAELWARKINANLKLWHIAQKLNDGWEPLWTENSDPIWYIFDADCFQQAVYTDHDYYKKTYIYFKTEELAQKAKRLMGDMLEDLYLEIY